MTDQRDSRYQGETRNLSNSMGSYSQGNLRDNSLLGGIGSFENEQNRIKKEKQAKYREELERQLSSQRKNIRRGRKNSLQIVANAQSELSLIQEDRKQQDLQKKRDYSEDLRKQIEERSPEKKSAAPSSSTKSVVKNSGYNFGAEMDKYAQRQEVNREDYKHELLRQVEEQRLRKEREKEEIKKEKQIELEHLKIDTSSSSPNIKGTEFVETLNLPEADFEFNPERREISGDNSKTLRLDSIHSGRIDDRKVVEENVLDGLEKFNQSSAFERERKSSAPESGITDKILADIPDSDPFMNTKDMIVMVQDLRSKIDVAKKERDYAQDMTMQLRQAQLEEQQTKLKKTKGELSRLKDELYHRERRLVTKMGDDSYLKRANEALEAVDQLMKVVKNDQYFAIGSGMMDPAKKIHPADQSMTSNTKFVKYDDQADTLEAMYTTWKDRDRNDNNSDGEDIFATFEAKINESSSIASGIADTRASLKFDAEKAPKVDLRLNLEDLKDMDGSEHMERSVEEHLAGKSIDTPSFKLSHKIEVVGHEIQEQKDASMEVIPNAVKEKTVQVMVGEEVKNKDEPKDEIPKVQKAITRNDSKPELMYLQNQLSQEEEKSNSISKSGIPESIDDVVNSSSIQKSLQVDEGEHLDEVTEMTSSPLSRYEDPPVVRTSSLTRKGLESRMRQNRRSSQMSNKSLSRSRRDSRSSEWDSRLSYSPVTGEKEEESGEVSRDDFLPEFRGSIEVSDGVKHGALLKPGTSSGGFSIWNSGYGTREEDLSKIDIGLAHEDESREKTPDGGNQRLKRNDGRNLLSQKPSSGETHINLAAREDEGSPDSGRLKNYMTIFEGEQYPKKLSSFPEIDDVLGRNQVHRPTPSADYERWKSLYKKKSWSQDNSVIDLNASGTSADSRIQRQRARGSKKTSMGSELDSEDLKELGDLFYVDDTEEKRKARLKKYQAMDRDELFRRIMDSEQDENHGVISLANHDEDGGMEEIKESKNEHNESLRGKPMGEDEDPPNRLTTEDWTLSRGMTNFDLRQVGFADDSPELTEHLLRKYCGTE
eukprot:CAMPEP_0115007166 /NCGR_PEP_ID=MMETSP0216-20121206/20988_1 /TAXON_ID=223996 /ORGANISM="Protocruzia adherens, Strain Boccale" /LENGTH=1049 /DNA_ID=CAMNT_0002373997 /DNA_START=190 /DNA_END=3339 /DNA_ORIENTATION=-